MRSGCNRAEKRTTGADRTVNEDCKHFYVRPAEFILRQDKLTQIRAHPGEMKRDVAGADCPLVCLRAAYLPNRTSAELRR